MIKKLLFIVVALTIVLSAITSVGAPVQSSNIESAETSAVTSTSGAVTWLMLTPTKDTSLSEASPDLNLGSNPNLYLQGNGFWNNRNSRYNIALEFNLNAVPKNAVITSATLSMYLHYCDEYDTASPAVSCGRQPHPDWVENEATFNVYKTGSNWGSPGGDWLNDGLSSLGELAPTYRGWIDFDVKTIVEDSLNLSIPAEFLVRAVRAESNYQFWSKEGDSWLGPKLEIEYTTDGSPTSTPTPTPTPVATPWSFAIITDTHIGEGILDYGSSGWNDDPNSGQDYNANGDPIPSVWNLKIAAGTVKMFQSSLNTKFVVVDGDLTDSAEISEFGKAKKILNVLNTWNIPWVPLLGNHDVWPYTSSSEAPQTETHDSSGVLYGPDWYFNNEMYASYINFSTNLFGSATALERGPIAAWYQGKYFSFQNFVFDYGGYHFIGLDFNDRAHAGPGVYPWANYWDITGGTWDWFLSYLKQLPSNGKDVILLAHHPMCGWAWYCFLSTTKMNWDLYNYEDSFKVQFAGHLHSGWIIDPELYEGPGCTIVKTKANKDDPMVRIVQVYPNGSINYDTLLPRDAASITVHCPVDLTVTDPDGLVINRSENQVMDAMYYKWDFDEDGQIETKIWIPERKPGNYSIQVIPESSAKATDTFTLIVSPMEQKWGYTPIDIAQNVTISNIPAEPYTFEFKQRAGTNISYSGAVSGYNLNTVNLTATLSTENGSRLSGKTVTFVIGNQSISAVTDANGVATTSIRLNQNMSGFYYVEYGFAGDIDYLPYDNYQPFVIPPVADAGGPYTGTEGSPITLNGSGTYDPESRALSYEWDLDNDGVYDDATRVTPAYTWNDDYSDSISLRVTDASGATSTCTTEVTVNNVPPTVEAGVDINNAIAGTAVNFTGSFTDPGTLDTHTIEWNFGDSSPSINGTLTPSHTYTASGNYTVILTVTDDDAGVGTDTLIINVMPATTTYTFTSGGGTNKWFSAGHIHLIDWNNGHPTSPSDFAKSYGYATGSASAYSAVSLPDSNSWRSNISHDLGCCAFDRNCELFKFKINESPSSITNIQIKWIGHGTTGETIYYTTEKLWKASNNTWNTLNNKMNITSDTVWTNNISSSCANYIDSTGNLSILVAAQRSGLPNNCGIWTNYIEVTIAHN